MPFLSDFQKVGIKMFGQLHTFQKLTQKCLGRALGAPAPIGGVYPVRRKILSVEKNCVWLFLSVEKVQSSKISSSVTNRSREV